jgi:hypothetical protein
LRTIIISREATRVAAPNPILPAERKLIGASTTHHQQTAKERETAKAAAQKFATQNEEKGGCNALRTSETGQELTGWII